MTKSQDLQEIKNDSKTCIVCGESIRITAKKCIHCDSFQSWRRYLNISTVTLSLLVALVSVLSAGAPVLKSTFWPKSNVKISFLDKSKNQIKVALSNSGERPAVLKGGTLSLIGPDKKVTRRIPFHTDANELILEPGKWRIAIISSTYAPFSLAEFDDNTRCRVEIEVIDSNHNIKNPFFESKCRDILAK